MSTPPSSKGAAVIGMLHQWLGGEVLRAGLHLYLTRHKGTSANTADLWAALQVLVPVGGDGDDGGVQEASGLPVARLMADWTRVQGFPLVTVDLLEGGQVGPN